LAPLRHPGSFNDMFCPPLSDPNQTKYFRLGRFHIIVVYINTVKTILDFNFDFYQAFKQHGYITWIKREAVHKNLLSLPQIWNLLLRELNISSSLILLKNKLHVEKNLRFSCLRSNCYLCIYNT